MKVDKSFVRHLQNIPGKRHKEKYLIIESDDWGSERIPSKRSRDFLIDAGIDIYSNPFNFLDSLETDNDLYALFETISKHRDMTGRTPVITANSVAVNPDFEKIEAHDYKEYFYVKTNESYSKKPGSRNTEALIREGMVKGLYHPQFHGREHLNVNQWLSSLQSGNYELLKAFQAGVYAVDSAKNIGKRKNLTAAFDFDTSAEIAYQEEIIQEGTCLFRQSFGYDSKSFIAPAYVWHRHMEVFLNNHGIRYIQGLPVQYQPDPGLKYKKVYHYQGEKNKNQQVYFVRNCFFEPAINPKFDWIEDCLRRLKVIFFWGKPAILGTHRINFIGSLDEENRKRNLQQFDLLLNEIISRWPETRFTTTDKLGDLYLNN